MMLKLTYFEIRERDFVVFFPEVLRLQVNNEPIIRSKQLNN